MTAEQMFDILFLPVYGNRRTGGSFKTWRPEEQQLGQTPLKMSPPPLKGRDITSFILRNMFRKFSYILIKDAANTQSHPFSCIS